MTCAEEWRSVCIFPNYEASSHGRIRHKERLLPLKPHYNQAGYAMVCAYRDGIGTTTAVHRLVALAFLGSRQQGLTINHKDGDKLNNKIDNLEYISMQANRQHAIDHGLWGFGERNGKAKLTENDVRAIRQLYGTMPMYLIGERFGITRQNVKSIVDKETWKHVA